MSADNRIELPAPWLHVCVDMQRLFSEPTVWQAPAMTGIVEPIVRLVRRAPADTIFTRFITPPRPDEARGIWRAYYRHYESVTTSRMAAEMLDLIAPLAALAPPARVCDKTGHSAFNSGVLPALAEADGAATIVLSGVETDVCVLATALDAIDLGYGVLIARDAVTSSDLAAHEAALDHVYPRFDRQLRVASADAIVAQWPES